MSGFYFMHRGWQDNPAFNNDPFSRRDAWVWLIETANYADGSWNAKGKTIQLKRGQLCRSYRDMAYAWKWDEAKVRRFCGRLQSDAMIRCVADAGVTVITICNYDAYQPGGRVGDAATDAAPTQKRRSTDAHNKEGNQGKEGNGEEVGEPSSVADAPDPPPLPTSPDLFADGLPPLSKVVKLPKGTRLSADWVLPIEWGEWAVERGAHPDVIRREAEKFRDYWHAKAGAASRKADWYATWRMWMRRTLENPRNGDRSHGAYRQTGNSGSQPAHSNAWAAAAYEHAEGRH